MKVIIIIMQPITIQFAVRVGKDYTPLHVYLCCVWVVIYVKYITYDGLLHNTLALDVDTVQVYTANSRLTHEKALCEMSLIIVEAIHRRCASFMSLPATVSEIFGGQTTPFILVV